MKKIIKFIKIAVICLLVLIIAGLGALYFFFPVNKIKTAAQDFVRENYDRAVDFEDVSLALIGVKIDNFKISEQGTFDNGTFAEAAEGLIKVDVLPLLRGEVRVKKILLSKVNINVVKDIDGKFNFDNFISGETATVQPQQENKSSSSFGFFAENIDLENSSFHYLDKQTKTEFSIDNLNIGIQNFSLNDFFTFYLNLQTALDMGDVKIMPLTVNLQGKANLADLNLNEAYIDIAPLILAYQNARITFNGQMKNFNNPLLNLEGKIEGINNKVITSIMPADLPVFALPAANITVTANVDLDNAKADITKADLSLAKSYIKNTAKVDFSKEDLSYQADTNLYLSLTDIYVSAKEMLKEIAPKGVISGNIKTVSATPEPKVKGKISLKNLGALIMGKELKNLSGDITINSLKDIKTNTISGSYNNSKFITSLAYSQPAKPINISLMLDLDKFTLDDINFDELLNSPASNQDSQTEAQPTQSSPIADFGTYNIKLDVKVKEVSNNVLTAKDLALKADLQNFSNDLSKLQGNLSFVSSDGEIRDIDKLMNSSKLFKAVFAAFKVVKQVFSVAKLEGITLGKGGTITYSQIEGVYTIKDGLVNLDKSIIASNVLTVKAGGTIDLASEKLNMTVNTHFGKVTTGSGFKPVVLNIKGTMNDPKYSVNVLSTVTSLLTVPGNVVKGGVKMSTNTASGVASGVKSGIKNVASTIGKLF